MEKLKDNTKLTYKVGTTETSFCLQGRETDGM